jgi:hypothetical protein
MRRVLRSTLAFAVTAVTIASVASHSAAQGTVATALQQTTAVTSKAHWPVPAPGEIMRLQVGAVLALSQPLLRAQVSQRHQRRQIRFAPGLSPRLALDFAARSRVPRWLDLGDTQPSLALPVTESISLGLGYSFQRSEDLVFKVARVGALKADYQNHKVLLRAQWEF